MANTTHRALRLLSLLGSRRQWPLREVATRLDVSERTVRRVEPHHLVVWAGR